MSKFRNLPVDTELYVQVGKLRMNDRQRRVALNALSDGDSIARAIVWMVDALKKLGSTFAFKPSVRA